MGLLASRGVQFDGPVVVEGMYQVAFFADPDGNRLSLSNVPPSPTTAVQGRAGLVATSEMTLHFLAPGRVGPVRAVGEVLRTRSGGAAVEVRVYDSGKGDRLMAVSLSAFSDLSGSARPTDSDR